MIKKTYKCKCGKKALWLLMSGTQKMKDSVYCDDCVPRGCSCNVEPIDGDYENEADTNWKEARDEKGRLLPCCEYWYYAEGVEF